jgi:opacity protein-like surface antigen
MKKLFCILLIILVYSIPSLAQDNNWTGNINLLYGIKYLDEDDWEPVEDQEAWGVSLDFKMKNWPVSIAIDYLYSDDDDTGVYFVPGFGNVTAKVEGETYEIDLGVRYIAEFSPIVKPFIGGGVSFIDGEVSASAMGVRVSEDDSAVGMWANAGVYFTIADHFNIGAQVRWSYAEIDIYGVDGDAGGFHLLGMAGFHW